VGLHIPQRFEWRLDQRIVGSGRHGHAGLYRNGSELDQLHGPFNGIAQVYIDGALNATVDTYAPAEHAQAVVYAISGLPAGPHTLTIKVTGTWNASGCCSWIVVDAFDVTS